MMSYSSLSLYFFSCSTCLICFFLGGGRGGTQADCQTRRMLCPNLSLCVAIPALSFTGFVSKFFFAKPLAENRNPLFFAVLEAFAKACSLKARQKSPTLLFSSESKERLFKKMFHSWFLHVPTVPTYLLFSEESKSIYPSYALQSSPLSTPLTTPKTKQRTQLLPHERAVPLLGDFGGFWGVF